MKTWDEIPQEVIAAERIVSLWFMKRMIKNWVLGHSQSRTATDRRKLELWDELKDKLSEEHHFRVLGEHHDRCETCQLLAKAAELEEKNQKS